VSDSPKPNEPIMNPTNPQTTSESSAKPAPTSSEEVKAVGTVATAPDAKPVSDAPASEPKTAESKPADEKIDSEKPLGEKAAEVVAVVKDEAKPSESPDPIATVIPDSTQPKKPEELQAAIDRAKLASEEVKQVLATIAESAKPSQEKPAEPASEKPAETEKQTSDETALKRPSGLSDAIKGLPVASKLSTDPKPQTVSYAKPQEDGKIKTDYLNLPKAEIGLGQRIPTPGTARLTSAWKLRWKIGEENVIMAVEDKIVIGRAMEGGDDSIQFDLTPHGAYHFGVSRMHAILTMNDGYLYLEDLNSTNGTRINGFQVTPKQKYRLRDGDEIEFARLRTTVKFDTPKK
jgi:hypothetical protein